MDDWEPESRLSEWYWPWLGSLPMAAAVVLVTVLAVLGSAVAVILAGGNRDVVFMVSGMMIGQFMTDFGVWWKGIRRRVRWHQEGQRAWEHYKRTGRDDYGGR